jgi:hypothetical protein
MKSVTDYFKILEPLTIRGNKIVLIDSRSSKETRYDGIGNQWQGHAVQDYLKERYTLESGYIMSLTDYNDAYGKNLDDTLLEIKKECAKRIKQFKQGDLNKRMPKLVTIGNYGWTMYA